MLLSVVRSMHCTYFSSVRVLLIIILEISSSQLDFITSVLLICELECVFLRSVQKFSFCISLLDCSSFSIQMLKISTQTVIYVVIILCYEPSLSSILVYTFQTFQSFITGLYGRMISNSSRFVLLFKLKYPPYRRASVCDDCSTEYGISWKNRMKNQVPCPEKIL